MTVQERGVVTYTAHKKGREKGTWDGAKAVRGLRRWASSDSSGDKGKITWPKYRQGFIWWDSGAAENFGSYKGPHHEVVGGAITTPLPGVRAAMAVLLGARGGYDVPEKDRKPMHSHLKRHYEQHGVEAPPFRCYTLGELRALFPELQLEEVMAETLDENDLYRGLCVRAPVTPGGEVGDFPAEVAEAFAESVGLADDGGYYIFPTRPSTQALDSYGTRMPEASIRRYAADAMVGVPLMNSHRTGGFLAGPAELPLGYSFFSETFGEAVDETPLIDRDAETWREDDLMAQGLTVRTFNYMLRGYRPSGPQGLGTDDVIQGIEGLSLRRISIGFGNALPERVQYVCGLCGLPIRDKDCGHVPLVRDKSTGLLGFVWVRGATMKEQSLVWAGATPGAIVEKARAVAKRGDLSAVELDLLESTWQVRVRPSGLGIAVPDWKGEVDMGEEIRLTDGEEEVPVVEEVVVEEAAVAAAGDEAAEPLPAEAGEVIPEAEAAPDGGVVPVEGEARVEDAESADGDESPAETVIRLAGVDGLVAAVDALTARVQEMERESGGDDDPDPLAETLVLLQQRLNALEQEREDDRGAAERFQDNLVDQAVRARVRAGVIFKRDDYRARLAGMSLKDVEAEIAELEAVVHRSFVRGRPTQRPALPAVPVKREKGRNDLHLYMN